MLEDCNSVEVKELVRPMREVLEVVAFVVLDRLEKRGFLDGIGVDNSNVIAVADCPDLSIAGNGDGSREVVRLVSQHFAPPRP